MTEVREQEKPTQYSSGHDEIPLPWLLAVMLRDRRTIVGIGLVGAVTAAVFAFSKAPRYTASFSFLPQSTQDQGRAGLASLAGQLGIPLGAISGQAQPPQLYADLAKTREVLAPIARGTYTMQGQQVRLPHYLDIGGADSAVVLEETMRALRENIVTASVENRTTGSVVVRTRTRSPELSLQISEKLLEGLNQFNRVTRQSQASEERRFTEGRLESARASLRVAEDALQRFLHANRQYGTSSHLRFEEDRLAREVALQQQVVTGLAQQYEDARIREVRDTPVITLIERPTLPVLPDPRGRVRTVIVFTFVSVMLGVMLVALREGWRRQRALDGTASYDALAGEWRRLRTLFKTL